MTQEALPEAHEKRVKRMGIVNAWDDEAFAAAISATCKRYFVNGGRDNHRVPCPSSHVNRPRGLQRAGKSSSSSLLYSR